MFAKLDSYDLRFIQWLSNDPHGKSFETFNFCEGVGLAFDALLVGWIFEQDWWGLFVGRV